METGMARLMFFEKAYRPLLNWLLARTGLPESDFWRIFRYLLSGGWNTVFGIGVYAFMISFPWGREHYLFMIIPANIISISSAFICYKLFVFKTKGNWIREYFKCYVVYASAIGMNCIMMLAFVDLIGMHPVVSQCVCVALTTIGSYIGHKLFSFRSTAREPQP